MELFKEILIKALETEETNIVFPNLALNIAELVNGKCYNALQKIKTIIEDNELSDKECFIQIEKIINALEEIGSSCGSRHDFG